MKGRGHCLTSGVWCPKADARNEVCVLVEQQCINTKPRQRGHAAHADAASAHPCPARTGNALAPIEPSSATADQRRGVCPERARWHLVNLSASGTTLLRIDAARRTAWRIDRGSDLHPDTPARQRRYIGMRVEATVERLSQAGDHRPARSSCRRRHERTNEHDVWMVRSIQVQIRADDRADVPRQARQRAK
ncbi:uncharacterized protein BDR25DRAFT_365479 [Lindgomyces ingoldianus]|uniref:Uncharacterized protein n=1 Tax=Lindgomyces ingoldianus TaxID=673940 RepID=A0ACB6RGE1_9PLEO|nr:uncharacterized protein BDR25DRAFT_365479 [Lindgomyces ingoldianus]KAF2478314.1 hypothetical protein BDR25DRAFT_365479 [Lindgomyces ingoldianus]